MTAFVPPETSAQPCALDQQVKDLHKMRGEMPWHTHYLNVTLHLIGGHTKVFDFDRLYIVSLHGDTTVFFEAKTLIGELIKDSYRQVVKVSFQKKTRPGMTN